jgi:hypothetical protein
MSAVSVVINNRNLLTWPRAMVERIEQFRSLAEIIIVDNGSTYEPLLQWYEHLPHRIVRTENHGHTAPWRPEINAEIKTDLYVVTDPDLDLAKTPTDCLEHLTTLLKMYPALAKVGLGLDISVVPPESPYYKAVNIFERRYWGLPLIDGLLRAAPVDTTFAIYDKKLFNAYAITGARTDFPYVAEHIPWSVIEPSEEFKSYLATANESSSYKSTRNMDLDNPVNWPKIGRNELCLCRSGLKFKHCHGRYGDSSATAHPPVHVLR